MNIQLSDSVKQSIAFGQLTPMQRVEIINAVGTRTKGGKVKGVARLRRDCLEYFVKNIYQA